VTDSETVWVDVWDKVFSVTKEVTGLGVANVLQGIKYPPVPDFEDVLVMVSAGTSSIVVSDTHGDYQLYSIPLLVFTKGDDMVVALKTCIGWVGKIKKKLLAHRTLDGLVSDIRFGQSRSNPPDVAGYERQLVSFVVEARIWVDDPISEE